MKFVAIIYVLVSTVAARSATLNITDFGARGDAISITANTVMGSSVVTVPASNALSSADTGKLMLLFGAGPATTPTNHQDLIATIRKVDDGTNITLSAAAGATSNNVYCTHGTQNAEAFQRCVDAATGTNTIIKIPAGNYLLVPPLQVTGFEMKKGGGPVAAAVVLRKGGIQFQGAGMAETTLTGCGAWKLQGKFAHRGWLFNCLGPVTNNTPLVFEDLTMDGGVLKGNTSNHGFPASVRDGSGWDETHDAVVDSGRVPLHQVKEFRNCRFTHWRGEILKGLTGGWDGYVLVTNCVFADANASAYNMGFTHNITDCTFTNLYFVSEFYEANCSNASYFQHNIIRDVNGAITINGALTNSVNPPYNIVSNTFYLSGGFGILTTPAENLFITGNQFICTNTTAALGVGCAGYQGSAINSNIVVAGNHFIGSYYAVEILGSGRNRTADMLVCSNTATGIRWFAGGYGWSTNAVFRNNNSATGLAEGDLKGQWFRDDLSNTFPPWKMSGAANKTNVIVYAHGIRQQISSPKTNCIFALDDAQPQRIPPGAELQLTFIGKYPAPLHLSTTRANAMPAIMLQTNATVTCVWTNGEWRRTGD